MSHQPRLRVLAAVPAVCCGIVAEVECRAGAIADYLDSIDFNDYALSLNYYGSESPYIGADDTGILYPMLSSFEHSTTTTYPLFVRDAYAGLRRVDPAGWTAGVVATIQTDGYGPTSSDALLGMQKRGWALAGGLTLGHTLGPLHADLFATTDLFDEHGGQVYDLKIAWPIVRPGLEIVPQVQLTRYSDDYVDYYYGVEPEEATPDRRAWLPGAATSFTAGVYLTWRLRQNWFLRGSVNVEHFPDAIAHSPIVDIQNAWRFGIGIAYDTGNFIQVGGGGGDTGSHFEAAIEAFVMHAKSVVVLEGSSADQTLRLENLSNLDERATAFPLTLTWRIGRYHALGLRYFELFREGAVELDAPQRIGGREFGAGSVLETRLSTRVLRLDYGFAVFRDPQKELAIVGGVHGTRFEYRAAVGDDRVNADTNAILPMLGANLRANFTERVSLHLGLEFFLLDFDQYSGSLIDFSAEGRYRVNRWFGLGAGYRYYRQDLESGDQSLVGEIRIDYRGPFLSLTASFD